MTQKAVRTWLEQVLVSAALSGLDVDVHSSLFKSDTATDMVLFTGFESTEEQLTFGNVGAFVQVTYTPELLLMLLDPSAEDAQDILDGYTQAVRAALRQTGSMIAITDPDTSEASKIAMIGPRILARKAVVQDLGMSPGEEGDAIATVVIQPTIVELFQRTA